MTPSKLAPRGAGPASRTPITCGDPSPVSPARHDIFPYLPPTALTVAPFMGSDPEWDSFGRAQAGWTAFHRLAWRRVITGTYGLDAPYLAARDADGALRGILPLVRLKSLAFGHYLVSMPYLNYGGPLGDDAAIVALADHADAMAQRDGVKLLELRSARALPLDLPVSHRKITVVLPLDGGAEAVFNRFKGKLRSQVRRPAKEGVTVRFGSDQVDPFHEVFARHMRDLGTPAQPRAFFRAIARELGDDTWFACAWLGDRPIAASAGFRWPGEFEMTWASSLREFNRTSANMGLYWAMIERAANEGLARFNFGRCSPGSATHDFKKQWGGVDEPLWWYAGRGMGDTATPSPDSAKFKLAVRVWQKLPLAVTNTLGPRIVRSIP
jgi:serine/alanine adding enzyme